MYDIAHLTDRGLKRDINEDSFLVELSLGLFVVSDGMGGHERGEIASKIIIDSFRDIFLDDDMTIPYFSNNLDNENTIPDEDSEFQINNLNYELNNVVTLSTKRIKEYANKKAIKGQMGTTVVGLIKVENNDKIAVFHLGDSRAYIVRDKEIKQLTVDHSKYERMKQSGKYTQEELSKVNRNSITKAIGNFREMSLEINYIDLKNNDIFFLCSDGVSDLYGEDELLNIIVKESNLDKVVTSIKRTIYNRGAKDNLTMIIFRYIKI